jgi:hypothetical protein
VKNVESVDREKVSVYDTTQYQGYRRLYNFVVPSIPDGIMTEVSETELTYENGDIFFEFSDLKVEIPLVVHQLIIKPDCVADDVYDMK